MRECLVPYGTPGFGWIALKEDKIKRATAQQFDLLADRAPLGAGDLLAKIPMVGAGRIEFSMPQKTPKDHGEYDWKYGASVLDKMLKSCASAAIDIDQRGTLLRELIVRIYTAEFVPVKPGTDDFDYAERVFVKFGTAEIVTPDYQGKKQIRYVAKGTKGPFVQVDKLYIGFVYTQVNELLRSKAVLVKELTPAEIMKVMGEALGPLFPYAQVLG
jgi:hypothetical protein